MQLILMLKLMVCVMQLLLVVGINLFNFVSRNAMSEIESRKDEQRRRDDDGDEGRERGKREKRERGREHYIEDVDGKIYYIF